MAYQPHVTSEQLGEWITSEGLTLQPPSDVNRYLRLASQLVDHYLQDCPPVHEDDTDATQAITDATLIQTTYWIQNSIIPMAEGLQSGKTVASASLLSGSMSFADADIASKNRAKAADELCFEARLTLGLAGIYPTTSVHVRG